MCYLKIPKDYLVRQYTDTAFGFGGCFRPNVEHYVFTLPGTEYSGYTFTVTDEFGRFDKLQTNGNWCSVHVSSDDMPLIVKHTENREDGKRYKQYKLTPDEINRLYGNTFKHAVAFIRIYADNGRMTASEVVETKYLVGMVDGCWFVSDELKKRRRIDTKGVKLLCYITADELRTVDEIIKGHVKRLQELDSLHTEVYRALNTLEKVSHWDLEYYLKVPEIAEVNDAAIKARQSLEARLRKIAAEIIELDTEFRAELTNLYGKAA